MELLCLINDLDGFSLDERSRFVSEARLSRKIGKNKQDYAPLALVTVKILITCLSLFSLF